MSDTFEVQKTLVNPFPLSSDDPGNKDRTDCSRSLLSPFHPLNIPPVLAKLLPESSTQVESIKSLTKSSNILPTNSLALETGAKDDKKESKLILDKILGWTDSTEVAELHEATLETFVSIDYITGLPPLPQRKPRGRRAKLLMSDASANSNADANVKSGLQKDSVQSALGKLASQPQQTSEQVSTGDSNIINKLLPGVSDDKRLNSSIDLKSDQPIHVPAKEPYRFRPRYPPGSIPATDLKAQISTNNSPFNAVFENNRPRKTSWPNSTKLTYNIKKKLNSSAQVSAIISHQQRKDSSPKAMIVDDQNLTATFNPGQPIRRKWRIKFRHLPLSSTTGSAKNTEVSKLTRHSVNCKKGVFAADKQKQKKQCSEEKAEKVSKPSNFSSTNSVGHETGAEDDKKESKLILMDNRHGSTEVAESHKATLETFVSADYITGLPPLPQRKPRGRRAKLLMSDASANSNADANVKSGLQKDSVQSALGKLASQPQQTSEQVSTGDSNIINKLLPGVYEDNRLNPSVDFKGDQPIHVPTKKPYGFRPRYPPGSIPATDLEAQISKDKRVFPSGNNILLFADRKATTNHLSSGGHKNQPFFHITISLALTILALSLCFWVGIIAIYGGTIIATFLPNPSTKTTPILHIEQSIAPVKGILHNIKQPGQFI